MKPLEALRALGTGNEPPEGAKTRVYGALLASLEVAALATAAVPKAPATLPPPATPLLAGMAGSKGLLVAAGIWLVGGATGAALYGALQREQVRVVYVDRPVAANLAAAPVGDAAQARVDVPRSAPAASISAPAHALTMPASSSPGVISELSRERALLDLARANAAHGEPALVLKQVEQHRQQFPQARLAEEREALAIRALLALGRGDEARTRANAFRDSYPNSFLTPVIDSALSAP